MLYGVASYHQYQSPISQLKLEDVALPPPIDSLHYPRLYPDWQHGCEALGLYLKQVPLIREWVITQKT